MLIEVIGLSMRSNQKLPICVSTRPLSGMPLGSTQSECEDVVGVNQSAAGSPKRKIPHFTAAYRPLVKLGFQNEESVHVVYSIRG